MQRNLLISALPGLKFSSYPHFNFRPRNLLNQITVGLHNFFMVISFKSFIVHFLSSLVLSIQFLYYLLTIYTLGGICVEQLFFF